MLSSWVAAWVREYEEEYEPCVTVALRNGEVVGAAPFVVNRNGRVRVAQFVGAHESFLADVMLAEGESTSVAERLLEPLEQAGAAALNAFGMPGDSVLAQATGSRLHTVPRAGSPVLEMPDGWEAAYERRTSKERRSKDRGSTRRLNKLGELEVTVARDGVAVGEALDAAFAIHRSRWEGRPDGSTFGQPERSAFIRSALCRLADEGRYGICLVRLDGRGVAFASFFQIGTTFYGDRTAFDPEFSRFGPGGMAQRHVIADCAARGVRRVEYLGDAEAYKRSLADRLDPVYQGVGLAHGVTGRLYTAKVLGTIAARKQLKKQKWLHRMYRSGALKLPSGCVALAASGIPGA